MTYVPPEKKQKGGTSGFGDIIYVLAFYLIEGSFIFLGIPVIILALGLVPISLYLIITGGGGGNIDWIFYLFGVVVVFFQILGMQYFIRKWVLEPNKMNFRQWIRWKFSPTEIKKRRAEKQARAQKMDEWYAGMDKVQESRDRLRDEQSYDLRAEWYKESGDPEILDPTSNNEESGIVLGETVEDDEIILGEEEETIELEVESEESEEIKEKESYSWS